MTTKKIDAEILKKRLVVAGFKEDTARMIVAQAAHETGNFTSMLYKEYNNPFGMKFPHTRKTTAKGSAYGYCTFENIESAAQDFRLYWKALKYQETFKSVSVYVDTLYNKGYFEALKVLYSAAVNAFYKFYYESD